MPHLAQLACVLLVSTLAACGGKSSEAPDDGGQGARATGGSSSGGSGSGGHAGNGSGGKGHAGSAGTGTGGADACLRFDDDTAAAVGVKITNETSSTIYLGQEMVTCGVSSLFQVADADGVALPSLGDCRSPCVSLRQQGAGGCVGICAFPNTFALRPGETLYTAWDGLFRVAGELPAKCVPYETGGETKVSCDQAKRIDPGTFTFSARAGSAVDCSQTTGSGSCSACSAQPNGGCSTPGSLITGPMHTAQATVLLNESYGVFPTSTAQSRDAGDAELPAPGDAIALLTVELVFKE